MNSRLIHDAAWEITLDTAVTLEWQTPDPHFNTLLNPYRLLTRREKMLTVFHKEILEFWQEKRNDRVAAMQNTVDTR